MEVTKCLTPSDSGSRIGDRTQSEPPAAPSGLLEGVDRRSDGAVSIGVIVEDGFQDGLQIPFDDFLCDSVADCWDAQRPGQAIALGKVNPPHWRRKVAP